VVGEPVLGKDADGAEMVQTKALSYFSRLVDSTTFGTLATAELHRRGVETAARVGAVVDGAEWCQTFIDLHAPEATRILDFPHAASYVDAIGQTVGAEGELLSAKTRTDLCHELKHSGGESVVERLRTTVEEAGYVGESRTQLAYLEKRLSQMAYPRFVAEQWPIASGSVESANKLVVEERLKGAGMHWAEQNVNPMLALRNAICSDRWEEVWMQIEQEQRRVEQLRRRSRQQRRCTLQEEARHSMIEECLHRQPSRHDDGNGAAQPQPPSAEQRRPAVDHPWRKAWSIRRQREIAATA
jgi:hypothetical protein